MTREQARRKINSLDYYLQNHTDDYGEDSHTAMMMAIKALEQEPCEDAISRSAAIDALDQSINIFEAEDRIRDLPSVKPQEPKTGHWIGIDEEPHEDYECDNCGYIISTYTANIEPHTEYKFCPNCGAKMIER